VPPARGSAAGRKFLAPRYVNTASAQCLCLSERFFFILSGLAQFYISSFFNGSIALCAVHGMFLNANYTFPVASAKLPWNGNGYMLLNSLLHFMYQKDRDIYVYLLMMLLGRNMQTLRSWSTWLASNRCMSSCMTDTVRWKE